MRLITRDDLERWARTYQAKADFPLLVSRLVKSSTLQSSFVNFPTGSAVNIGGWDGIVASETNTGFVPIGTSYWELGTAKKVKAKTDSDYKKRIDSISGEDKKNSTYIFVTPNIFKKKGEWREEKIREGDWKEVKIFDSIDLEEWLDSAPAVSRWFSSLIGKYPHDGIITIEEFWKEWSIGPTVTLLPEVVTAGREQQIGHLLDFLKNSANIKGIMASSKDEAIAFIIASAMQFAESDKQIFHAKSLIINSENNFRSIRINTSSLNLITRFDEQRSLFAAAAEGHHVLVPLGPDDDFNNDKITLPLVDRDGQIQSLVNAGLSEDDAVKYSKESGRNITILRRLLRFPQNKSYQTSAENLRLIVPALILGRWDENKIGDRNLLEKLSGENYDDYIDKLSNWKDFDLSPFMQFGNSWRLVSPLDAWTNLAPHITKSDLERLKQTFLIAFENGNPTIEAPSSSPLFAYLGRETTYSQWAREGLVQSLILLGLYGDNIKIRNIGPAQTWVDHTVNSLFEKANRELWISLRDEIPLIAEASPVRFMDACFESLSLDNPPIMAMFQEKDGVFAPRSNHSGLLWALEGLAWEPEFLKNSTLLLSELAARDPGGKLGNRPINSLIEIFKPWHYQTFATLDERIDALKVIAKQQKNVAWDLLVKLLPRGREAAFGTHKMRWRMFEKSFNRKYFQNEVLSMHSAIVDILIESYDYSEKKLSRLLDCSIYLARPDRDKVLDFADSIATGVTQIEFCAWNTLREIISFQKSFPNSENSLADEELYRYEKLYLDLTPANAIGKYIWLFNEGSPRLPEGTLGNMNLPNEKRWEANSKIIVERRIEGLREIIKENGLTETIHLSEKVKLPASIGSTLAHLIEQKADIFFLMEFLNTKDKKLILVQSFIRTSYSLKGSDWIVWLYNKIKSKKYSNAALANFLTPLPLTSELLKLIQKQSAGIKREFWMGVAPNFWGLTTDEKILGIESLVKYKRFFTAIESSSFDKEVLPAKLIFDILTKAATEKASEEISFSSHQIELLFEKVDNSSDIEHDKLIQLEWLYLPILSAHGSQRNPKMLHDELSKNPQFFTDVLKFLYIPKSKKLLKEERKGLSNEIIQNRGKQAYQLLESWKGIPGMMENGHIDGDFLNAWITEVRTLAKQSDRLEVADMQIGKILAHYPERNSTWPPDEIANVIESINTDAVKQNYRSELFNKRGFSTRAMDSGGDIEREHAKYFDELSLYHKTKHPILSGIFRDLANGYRADAERQDEDAKRNKLEY